MRGSLELYDRNTCYTTDRPLMMAKANPNPILRLRSQSSREPYQNLAYDTRQHCCHLTRIWFNLKQKAFKNVEAKLTK